MTEQHDFDRVLGSWLMDGHTRAPEAPVAAAIAHARRHPRRPDPFAALRADPMAGRSMMFGLQPAWAMFLLGLLLAATVGVAVVGNQRGDVVVPPAPSPEVTNVPEPSPVTRSVPLEVAAGNPLTVEVIDRSGLLVEATSGTPGEGASVPAGTIAISNVDPTSVQLVWMGSPCDEEHTLTIAADQSDLVLERPACQGDAMALDRVLLLRFSEPVEAQAMRGTIVDDAAP